MKVPVHRLPDTLFPILTDAELERVWSSRYLPGRSALASRNRALIGLMPDTRRGGEPDTLLDRIERSPADGDRQGQEATTPPLFQRSPATAPRLADHSRRRDGVIVLAQGLRGSAGLSADPARRGAGGISPHLLRHQPATMLVRNNTDLESVRGILRHADLSTTAKYLTLSDDDLRAKHAAASPYEAMRRTQPRPLWSSTVSFLISNPRRVPVKQARFVPASFH